MRPILCLTLLLQFFLIPIQSQTYSGGSGTNENPYKIASKADLETLCITVNGGEKYQGTYFILTTDIDLRENGESNYEWTPIGLSDELPFCGIFNGNGHIISNLYIGIQRTQYERSGFFGTIHAGGQVLNLILKNGEIKGKADGGDTCTGSIAGAVFCGNATLSCTLQNCHNQNIRIMGDGLGTNGIFTGGIVGYAWSQGTVDILYCSNQGAVISGSINNTYTGGIVGYSFCDASGILQIQNCENHESVTGNGTESVYVGGITGESDSYNSGHTSISNCFNTGYIQNEVVLQNSYAGGITAFCEINSTTAGILIEKCHNYGKVSVQQQNGGLIGNIKLVAGSDFTIVSCYWNKDINTALSGMGTPVNEQAANIISLTEEEFKIASNFDKNQQYEVWNNETAKWNIGTESSAWEYKTSNLHYPTLKKDNTPSSFKQITKKTVTVYPVIVENECTIEGIQNLAEPIRVYNSLGKLIATHWVEESKSSIPVAELNQGIYFLTVDGQTVKIIKN